MSDSRTETKLKQRRIKAGLSLTQASAESGVPQATFYSIECGKASASPEHAELIAAALNTTVGRLFKTARYSALEVQA